MLLGWTQLTQYDEEMAAAEAKYGPAFEKFRAELLPVTPTFLNLLLLSGAHKRRDLSSLKVISYGAESMPEGTLQRLARLFPNVRLQQTYGLIELGALRTKSKSSDSLWVRVGGEGYQTRVVDGMLQIKSRSAAMHRNGMAVLKSWLMTWIV